MKCSIILLILILVSLIMLYLVSSSGENRDADADEPPVDEPNDKPQPLYLLNESKIIDLFPPSSVNKFEASGVVLSNTVFYVIFDNLFGLGAIKNTRGVEGNSLHLSPGKDSQYEAISCDRSTGKLYVLTETTVTDKGNMAKVQEISTTGVVTNECVLDFIFPSANKGFEGMFVTDKYLVALCEGNNCEGGKKGKQKGNGKLIVFTKSDKCWNYKNTWAIPPHVMFTDYSDITYFKARLGRPSIAITSQEDG